jgi:hypothetical protein
VWRPGNRNLGSNVYIVRMAAGGVTKSQKIVLAR